MKKIVTSFIASIALVSTLNAADFYATVDGEKITKDDVAIFLQDPRADFDKLPQEAKSQILEGAINRKLIAKNTIKNGIEKNPEYVEAIAKIKEDLALQVWQDSEIKKIKSQITDTEKRAFYEANRTKFNLPDMFEVLHILVEKESEALAIIKDLEKATAKEAKFKELASSKSKAGTAKNGGYIGKVAAEQVPELAIALKAIPKGGHSKIPTKTDYGYQVLFVKEISPAKQLSYDEVKDNIEQALISEKFNKKLDELVKELRKDSKIVIK